MKNKLVLLILAVLLVSCQPYTAIVAPVLMNGGFEEGWHLATTYWTPEGGPFHDQYQEITPPEEWTAWWREGFPCAGTEEHLNRRPEVRIVSRTPDPARVHSHHQAVKFFTFWGCHRGGLYQQITVEPGKHYAVQAFGHSWFSNCSAKPHYRLPLDYDCDTDDPILWAQDWLSIGLDPLGGIDPTALSVEWSVPEQIYGRYGKPLRLKHVLAVSDTMTVFLESDASHPLKHDDVYWDDVTFSESYQVFLPYAAKE